MTKGPLRPIRAESDLAAAYGAPIAVVFKHSPRCGISSMVRRDVLAFAERHPEVPVYLVDVVGARSLSQSLAARLGVRHESPQVIVLREGVVLWHESQGAITLEVLSDAVERAGDAA